MNLLEKLKDRAYSLWSHIGFRRYFSNTAWLFAEKVFRVVVGLFVGVWVARYLGPEKYGLLSYARSFVALFGAIAALGLDSIVVRELVKDESKRDVLLGTSFALKLVGAIVALFVIWIATRFTNNDSFANLLIFIVACSLVFQSFNVVDLYFQSRVLSKYAVLANATAFFFSSVAKVILLLLKAPLIAFAIVAVFDTFVLAVGYLYVYVLNGLSILNWKFDFDVAKSLLKDSWPLVFSGLVVSIYMRIDQVMIKNMLSDWAVGQYAAAVRLSEAWYFVPVVVCTSLFPAVVSAKQKNVRLYYDRMQRLYNLMVVISVVVSLFFSIFGTRIILLLFGASYVFASKVLLVHVWTTVFVFIGVAYSRWLVVENYTRKNMYRTSIGALTNVILNLILIRLWGIVGAAVATLASQVVANLLYDIFDSEVRIALKQKLRALIMLDTVIKPVLGIVS